MLKKRYPKIKTALENWKKDYELLFCIILSAQSTDKQINKITKNLFQKFPTLASFANCELKDLEEEIFSSGFYKSKAKSIKSASNYILENFGGKVPKKIDELVKIPGVARKTANVFLSVFFDDNEKIANQGIAVDTHVKRVSSRLGLTKNSDPEKIEQDLLEIIPQKDWGRFSLSLVQFGRDICQARNPKCEICELRKICDFIATAE